MINSLELSNDSRKLGSSCRHYAVVVVVVDTAGASGACCVGASLGRRTVFVAKLSKSKEEFVKSHSKVVPFLQRGQAGCGFGGLRVSDVIVDRSVDDGGVERG